MRVGDRLDVHRIGHDYTCDIGAQHPNHRHGIARRFDDDFVLFRERATEALQPRSCHVDSAYRPETTIFPKHYFRKSTVDVHTDYASHLCFLHLG